MLVSGLIVYYFHEHWRLSDRYIVTALPFAAGTGSHANPLAVF
jgi:hypothetical protein